MVQKQLDTYKKLIHFSPNFTPIQNLIQLELQGLDIKSNISRIVVKKNDKSSSTLARRTSNIQALRVDVPKLNVIEIKTLV